MHKQPHRLRHLRSVQLKNALFHGTGRPLAYYKLYLVAPEGPDRLLYVSEKVVVDFDVEWDSVAEDLRATGEDLNVQFHGQLRVLVFLATLENGKHRTGKGCEPGALDQDFLSGPSASSTRVDGGPGDQDDSIWLRDLQKNDGIEFTGTSTGAPLSEDRPDSLGPRSQISLGDRGSEGPAVLEVSSLNERGDNALDKVFVHLDMSVSTGGEVNCVIWPCDLQESTQISPQPGGLQLSSPSRARGGPEPEPRPSYEIPAENSSSVLRIAPQVGQKAVDKTSAPEERAPASPYSSCCAPSVGGEVDSAEHPFPDPQLGGPHCPGPLLDYVFSLDDLELIGELDLHERALPFNQLVIEMSTGLYLYQPPSDSDVAGATVEEPIEGEVEGGPPGPSALPLPPPSIIPNSTSQQQLLFKWMMGSTGAVEPLALAHASSGDLRLGPNWDPAVLVEGGGGLRSILSSVLFGTRGSNLDDTKSAASVGGPQASSPSGQGEATRPKPSHSRVYDVREYRAGVKRLIAAFEKLREAQERQRRVAGKVHEVLMARARQREQAGTIAHRTQVRDKAKVLGGQCLSHEVALLGQRKSNLQQYLVSRVEALVAVSEAMEKATGRLSTAKEQLRGGEGEEKWRALHARLMSRRNYLVRHTAKMMAIGPAQKDFLQAAPLDERIDRWWWQSMDPDSGAKQEPRSTGPTRRGDSGGVQLSIAGLDLGASVARRGLEGTMGWNGNYDEEQRVAAALGYVALVVQHLAKYLDVPLRYPVAFRGSKSLIWDPAPPPRMQKRDRSGGRRSMPGEARRSPLSPVPTPATPVQRIGVGVNLGTGSALPLYYEAGDRLRFVYATFLVNKDLEQLLSAHGLQSLGPTSILANLYQLILAAWPEASQGGTLCQGDAALEDIVAALGEESIQEE